MCHRVFKQTPTHTGLSLTKAASTLDAGAVPGKNPHTAAEAEHTQSSQRGVPGVRPKYRGERQGGNLRSSSISGDKWFVVG